MLDAKTVLVLAPHTDDGEFGCGGTVAKLVQHGSRIVYVAFSAAEQSVPQEFPRDILRSEVKEATNELGIESNDCIVLSYEVRRFVEFRQAILDDMIRLRSEYAPDLVFAPSREDTHQDHEVIAREAFRAFKYTNLLGYESPRNQGEFSTTCFSILTASHVEQKVSAIAKYKSQSDRVYAKGRFITSLAVTRGVQANADYAEAFEVVRWLVH